VPQTLVAVPVLPVMSVAKMSPVLRETSVVKDVVVHLATHAVDMLPVVVRRRTLCVVTEVVVPNTSHVVLRAVVTLGHLFVAPMGRPVGQHLQTARWLVEGEARPSDRKTSIYHSTIY